MRQKNISSAVIARLPRYFRYLEELKDEGVERVSSSRLSEMMHVTASQIRQDLNHFGGFGQQGYGYNVAQLHKEIGRILDLEREHSLIIIGCGNLGKALANYGNFRLRGFRILGLFDVKKELEGTVIAGAPVYMIETIESFLKEHPVDIAVIAIPKQEALKLVEPLTRAGIKAVWNFSHTDLPFPEDITVQNVHLSESLMVLSYRMREHELYTECRPDESL